jgi:hypothetical protein
MWITRAVVAGSPHDTAMAARTPRAFWLDPRFLIGVLLVAGSVGGVVAVVAAADETVEVYAAGEALVPGDELDPDDLVAREVRLGPAEAGYLLVADWPGGGAVVTRPVAEGELLPLAALGDAASVDVASVVVRVEGDLAEAVAPGAAVDLWASAARAEQAIPPVVLVPGATVARVVESEGMVVAGQGVSVELIVPEDRVARVLEAVAADGTLALVPIGRGLA